jgi:glyoxylase-like metal-dependent hydrolase (beta-lactamase superfamily II)
MSVVDPTGVPLLRSTFAVGDLQVSALSDGAPARQIDNLFAGVAPDEWLRLVGLSHPQDPVPFNFGSFLIRGDGHTTLIDTGWGAQFRTSGAPGGGELLHRLREVGVSQQDVDTIVHTHLHGDHCGWDVNDDDGGALTFPNATVYVAQAELDYWTGPEADSSDKTPYVRSRVLPVQMANRLRPVTGDFAVSAVLTMIPTPGHTPGHCSIVVASAGEHLIILGDAAHHPVHLEHPDWIPAFDLDPAESRHSRKRIAELAADRDALVTGGHFPILTLGRLRRESTGYCWLPVESA